MIWLPSKPSSILMSCSLLLTDELREYAVGGIRVHEGDLEAEEARARLGVDQLGSVPRELAKRAGKVGDLVGDVVHPRASLREKLADGRVGAKRRHQLQPPTAARHRHTPP